MNTIKQISTPFGPQWTVDVPAWGKPARFATKQEAVTFAKSQSAQAQLGKNARDNKRLAYMPDEERAARLLKGKM